MAMQWGPPVFAHDLGSRGEDALREAVAPSRSVSSYVSWRASLPIMTSSTFYLSLYAIKWAMIVSLPSGASDRASTVHGLRLYIITLARGG